MGEADGLTVGVRAVELANCGARIGKVGISDKGDAFAAVLAVVEEGYRENTADACEEFLGVQSKRYCRGRMPKIYSIPLDRLR